MKNKISIEQAHNDYVSTLNDYENKSTELSKSSAKLDFFELKHGTLADEYYNPASAKFGKFEELFELYDNMMPEYDKLVEEYKKNKSYVKIAFVRFKKAKKLYEKLKKKADKKAKHKNDDESLNQNSQMGE